MAARSSNNGSSSTKRLEELERLRASAAAAGQATTPFVCALKALN